MRVIVCGAGRVGSSIARYLAAEGNDVTVVDRQAALIERLSETLDVQAVRGHASSPDVLAQAGAEDADLLIAATRRDEVNMIACQVAHSLFNTPTKIARIRETAYLEERWSDLFRRDGLPVDFVISPEREVARAVLNRILQPGATEILHFAGGRIRLIGARLDGNCPIINTPLRQLTALFPDLAINVVGIRRGEDHSVPAAADQMLAGDEVWFVVDAAHTARAMAAFGHEEAEARRVVLVGGGNVGRGLAGMILQEGGKFRLRVVERDDERALDVEEALSRHGRGVVLHGDVLDEELFAEAGFASADVALALTDDDETNILASLLAKRQGTRRTIALINKPAYGVLMSPLDIDVVINPRSITISQILQHVRRGRVLSAHSIGDEFGEVLEFEILETSGVVGKGMKDLKLPSGAIVGGILREDEVVIPRGDVVFRARDRVVLFVTKAEVKTVEKLFAVRLEFF